CERSGAASDKPSDPPRWRNLSRRPLPWTIEGIVTLESDWSPPLGDALTAALGKGTEQSRLDLGCVAAHGLFNREDIGRYVLVPHARRQQRFCLN
ncbi:MAG: hypothetical protein WCB74_00015, partial [Pseudolabrys sp.]